MAEHGGGGGCKGVTTPAVAYAGRAAQQSSPSREFAQLWGLGPDAEAFLDALPGGVSSVVFNSFTANGTKDGNVWGRLFGFVRSVWVQRAGLDGSALSYLRSLPEEMQIHVMTQCDPTYLATSVAGTALMTMQQIVEGASTAGAEAAPNAHADSGSNSYQDYQEPQEQGYDTVQAFVTRCGLGKEAVDLLEGLDAEVQAAVISDFDAGGTKDGNVFARLQGFARAVENTRARKRRGGLSEPQGTRPRTDGWS